MKKIFILLLICALGFSCSEKEEIKPEIKPELIEHQEGDTIPSSIIENFYDFEDLSNKRISCPVTWGNTCSDVTFLNHPNFFSVLEFDVCNYNRELLAFSPANAWKKHTFSTTIANRAFVNKYDAYVLFPNGSIAHYAFYEFVPGFAGVGQWSIEVKNRKECPNSLRIGIKVIPENCEI